MPKMSMPNRSHHAAPRFDGKSASLSLFLDDIEYLAKACRLSQKDTIKWTIRYSPSIDRELWEMQESVETGDWEQFKEELYDLYPGSKGENKYSAANLQSLIDKQNSIAIRDAEDYGTYHQSFLKMSSYLRNKSRLSKRETSIYFLQGLEPSFRCKVQAQMKAESPKQHPDDPYSIAEISASALFVLSCNHTEFSCQEVPSISIKKESLDLSQVKTDLIINAITAAITKKPNTEFQQGEKRMDKQQDIQFKKELEVSSLKKPNSNTISEPQYRYISPINDSNLARKSPDPAITIPAQYREQKTEQSEILAIEVQDSPQDTKPLPISKESILVLTNSTQETSEVYDKCRSHLSQALQKVETPADEDLPSEAASALTPSQPESPLITEFLLRNPDLPPESILGKHNGQERKYSTPADEDWFLWPEKDNPAQCSVNKHLNSQSTGSEEDKNLFNMYLDPNDIPAMEYKSNILKISANLIRIHKPTQDKIHSQEYSLSRNADTFEKLNENSRDPSPINLKQYANSLISKAHCRMISLILEANQKMLAHQFQELTLFCEPPLSTISTSFAKSAQIIQGVG